MKKMIFVEKRRFFVKKLDLFKGFDKNYIIFMLKNYLLQIW